MNSKTLQSETQTTENTYTGTNDMCIVESTTEKNDRKKIGMTPITPYTTRGLKKYRHKVCQNFI